MGITTLLRPARLCTRSACESHMQRMSKESSRTQANDGIAIVNAQILLSLASHILKLYSAVKYIDDVVGNDHALIWCRRIDVCHSRSSIVCAVANDILKDNRRVIVLLFENPAIPYIVRSPKSISVLSFVQAQIHMRGQPFSFPLNSQMARRLWLVQARFQLMAFGVHSPGTNRLTC